MGGWMAGYIWIELALSKGISKPRWYPRLVNTSTENFRYQDQYTEQENFLKINSLKCIHTGPFAYKQ